MKLFIALIGGFVAAMIHRMFFSPKIGKLKHQAQSVLTPAIGVGLAFPVVILSVDSLLHVGMPDMDDRDDYIDAIVLRVAYTYIATFLAYGATVVLTIIAGIGGVKET